MPKAISGLPQQEWVLLRSKKVMEAISFKNGDSQLVSQSTSLYANNSEVLNFEFEAALYIYRRIGISCSFTNVLRGEIVAAAPAYSVGLFYDMNRPWNKK